MALSLITPVASSVILAGDGITFSVPDTYTSLIITITADAGAEVAYNSATGAGAGYTVTVANAASVDTITVKRDVGWDLEPQAIEVAVLDPGGNFTEAWSYYLGTTRVYPQNSQPLNPVYVGTLIVTEDDVQVRDDVGWIDFDDASFNVVDMGSGKVRVTGLGMGGASDLDSAINAGTPDNDVIIPVGNPVVFRDNSAALTPLTVSKLEGTSSTPALLVEAADNFSRALVIKEAATNQQTVFNYDGVTPTGQYSITWGGGNIAGAGAFAPVYMFGNDDSTGNGGIVYIKGGDATAGTDDGGASYLVGGDTVGGVEGVVYIGRFTTSEVILDATSNLKADTPLKIKEQAAADADTAGYGQHWVRISDGAPMFTDAGGNDFVLNVGRNLDEVLTDTPDNDVIVPSANPIILRQTSTGYTPLTVRKASTADNIPALEIEVTANTDTGIQINDGTDSYRTWFRPQNIYFQERDGPGTQYKIQVGDLSGGSNTGGSLAIEAGGVIGADDGGDLILRAGSSTGGAPGTIWLSDGGSNAEEIIAANRLKAQDNLFVLESASADADITSYGQFWVRASDGAPMFTDDGGTDYQLNAAGAGGSGGGMGQWDYATGGGAPASTILTANSDTLSSVTTLNISDASGSDNSFSIAFVNVKIGDYIILRDNAGGGAHGTFLVTGAVDNTTYWTFTVTTANVAGTFSAGNTYDVWTLSTAGTGDVVGPSGSEDNSACVFDSTTGKLVQEGNLKVGTATAGTGTRFLGANAVISGGYIVGAGGVISASGDGAAALGGAVQTGAGIPLVSSGGVGTVVIGTAAASSTGNATLLANVGSDGSFVIGRAISSTSATSILQSNASLGALVAGYATTGGIVEAISGSTGAFVHGYSAGGGIIRASAAEGAFANGYASGAGATITVGNDGAFANGLAASGGDITASSSGAFANGFAIVGAIEALNSGAFASGYCISNSITASAPGSFAFGATISAGNITASGQNSVQFGVGVNSQATSLQVGNATTGVRINGNGAPTTPHNGDIWVATADVTIRSAGVNQVFNRPTVTGSRGGNAALTSLLTQLAAMNLIVDSST